MRHLNRQQAQEPRGKSFWCGKCDANLLMAGQRCDNTYVRNGKIRRCNAINGKPGRVKKPRPLGRARKPGPLMDLDQ